MNFSKLSQIDSSILQSGFRMDDYWIWCGSIIADPEYGFHMYASRWPKAYPMFEGYIFQSEIVRAWSSDIQGPYHFMEKVLPGNLSGWNIQMAHNPSVLKYNDQYLLYFIGSHYDFQCPSPSEAINQTLVAQVYSNIRIGLAISDTPTGPWQVMDKPILSPQPGAWDRSIVTNPAPCILPDGRIYLYYRSNTPNGLRIGLAQASQPHGPYTRISPDPIMPEFDIEDPFVWFNGEYFEMMAKDMKGTITGELHAGAHFISPDGIEWKPQDNPQIYSRAIETANTQHMTLGCMERPQIVFGNNRKPLGFLAAVADGPGGFTNAQNTWNIVVEL